MEDHIGTDLGQMKDKLKTNNISEATFQAPKVL